MMGSLFSSLFGGPDNDNDNNNDHPHAGQRDTQASPGPGPSGRTYTFNIGGGTGSVTFGSFGGGGGGGGGGGMAMGPFGPYHPAGPSGGDQGGGLDACVMAIWPWPRVNVRLELTSGLASFLVSHLQQVRADQAVLHPAREEEAEEEQVHGLAIRMIL